MADYGFLSKLLHQMSLGNDFVGELCFDIELGANRKEILPSIQGRHVFVSGLARAGTTVLMRSIYETGEFASLTYRDMPFVLAPNIWAKIVEYTKIEMDKKNRAHGDGILVDFDSPEALEEIFWKTFLGGSYIKNDRLLPHAVDDDTVKKFREYISLVLMRYGKSRYLSKNNNNVLRLKSILEAFPCATILVPFREQLQQAYSLLKQHQRFKKDGSFTEKYMGWLAHHEFGSDHRPFDWGIEATEKHGAESIDYWLLQWICTYSSLDSSFEKQSGATLRVIFICYESLCSDATRVWGALSNKLELNSSNLPDFNMQLAEIPRPNPLLKNMAESLYEKLVIRSHTSLGLCK